MQSKLVLKLKNLGLCSAICWWIYDFLTGRPQTPTHLPVCIHNGTKVFGDTVHMTDSLCWSLNTSMLSKKEQQTFFLPEVCQEQWFVQGLSSTFTDNSWNPRRHSCLASQYHSSDHKFIWKTKNYFKNHRYTTAPGKWHLHFPPQEQGSSHPEGLLSPTTQPVCLPPFRQASEKHQGTHQSPQR